MSDSMTIIEMRVTPIALTDPPLRSAFGLHAPYALRTIIELVTDTGITGISETHGGDAVLQDLEAARSLIIGSNPYHLSRLEYLLRGEESGHGRTDVQPWEGKVGSPARTFGAIEVACLDIIGQATGQPLCNLLGGRFRESVPFSAYLFYKHAGIGGTDGLGPDSAAARERDDYLTREALDAASLVRQAQEMCEQYGFQSLKLKGGVLPPDQEVQTIFALREAFGPDTPLRIDPNAVWSVPTAVRCGQEMAGVLEYYEDPVQGKEAMAEVARQVAMPLATNMCCTKFTDLPESIRLGSIQILLSDHHLWGGLMNSVKVAKICEVWGIGLSMHSNSHLGISLLAMTHLAAAIPNLTYACDTHYPWQTEEVLECGKIRFVDGSLPVPTTPGLGAKLDQDALAALHENYIRCGLTCRDDVLEMQKVEPGWKVRTW
ncbi:MAG: glucarate dehydratase family protein [Armatimonadaceae bacterium]